MSELLAWYKRNLSDLYFKKIQINIQRFVFLKCTIKIQLTYYDKILIMSIFDFFFYIYHAFFLIKKCTVLTYKNKQFHRSFCETFNQIEKNLTIILPNMEDPRMKIKSKTLTSMDILEHRAFFHKILYASRKISYEIKKVLICCWRFLTYV